MRHPNNNHGSVTAALLLVLLAVAGCAQREVQDATLSQAGSAPSSTAARSAGERSKPTVTTGAGAGAVVHAAYSSGTVRSGDDDNYRRETGGRLRAAKTPTTGGGFYRTAAGSAIGSPAFDSSRGLATGAYVDQSLGIGSESDLGRWRGESSEPLLVAAAGDQGAAGDQASVDLSPECAAFAKDIDADLGEVLRAGCEPTLAQMSALMDNPLGNVAMLFTQIDLYRMENPNFDKPGNKWNYMGIAQFPKAINKDWNLINRVVWNVPSMPIDQGKINRAADRGSRLIGSGNEAVLPPTGSGLQSAPITLFDGRTTGFGDIYYVGLFSPKKAIELAGGSKFVWGAGFDLGFPTATDDVLGTGRWLAGPSALGVYLGPKWKVGALLQHYWDYAGDDDRDDVNMTNLQYFYMYGLNETTSIGAAPNIIANWEQNSDNAFTIPVGLGINRTFQFGKVPVRVGAEVYYSVVTPNDTVGAEWNFRFYVIPAAPSALFKWMTTPLFGS